MQTVQIIPPRLELFSQAREVNPALGLSELFQFLPTFLQERLETRGIPPRAVMERGGDLDKTMEKRLLFALRHQPHGFQSLMGFKKFPRVKQADTLPERSVHSFSFSKRGRSAPAGILAVTKIGG